MHSDRLSDLLVGRIRQHKGLDLDIMAAFVGVSRATVEKWLEKKNRPNGERLNRLWHFLAAVDISSPELDRITPYHRLLSELHAYGVVRLKDSRADGERETDLLEILGIKQEQDALRIIRGDQTPSRPLFGTVDELIELYGSQLDEAKNKWQEEFARALTVKPPRTSGQPASVADVTHPETDGEPDDEEPAETEQSIAVPVGLSAALVAPPAPPTSGPSLKDNSALMLELARTLAAALPLANYALTDECSDADRALMRQLLGRDPLFALGQALTRLSSTRAFHNTIEGR